MSKSSEIESLLDELREDGWEITKTNGGHWRASRPGWVPIFSASTPSDKRNILNQVALVRRIYAEHGEEMPRDRKPEAKAPQPAHTEFHVHAPTCLPADYAFVCGERDALKAVNKKLEEQITTLSLELEQATRPPEPDPAEPIIASLLSPYAPLIYLVRDQHEQMQEVKRDVKLLERAMINLRDGKVDAAIEQEIAKLPTVESKSTVKRIEVQKSSGKQDPAYKKHQGDVQRRIYDKSAGPPRPGMVWRKRGNGAMSWAKPTPRYCWFCAKPLDTQDYFCDNSHAKKYMHRHPEIGPVTAFRTRANMTYREAKEQS